MALFVVGAYYYYAFVVDSYYSYYYACDVEVHLDLNDPLAALEGHSYYYSSFLEVVVEVEDVVRQVPSSHGQEEVLLCPSSFLDPLKVVH